MQPGASGLLGHRFRAGSRCDTPSPAAHLGTLYMYVCIYIYIYIYIYKYIHMYTHDVYARSFGDSADRHAREVEALKAALGI